MDSFLQRAFFLTYVSIFSVLTLLVGLGLSVVNPVAAGTILVSGDVNIVDPLSGTQGATIDTGNQQFFSNILQGGASVAVLEYASYPPEWNFSVFVNTFYNSLPGVTSTIISGVTSEITEAELAGIDLFISPVTRYAFSANEITSLGNFLTGGGSAFFLGDHAGAVLANQRVNDALAALGSSISIIPSSSFDIAVYHTATGSQIVSDPLTAGVTTFSYNAASELTGGTTLFLGSEGQPFVAFEESDSSPGIIPIPATVWLFGSAFLGLIGISRRKKTA